MGSKNDLSNRINESYSKLSKGQKLLATYITDNYDKAVFLTAAKLGEVVGVSESTVVRFAMHLGYRGYPEFQSALEELVRNKLNSIQRMEVTYGRISQSKILESVLKSDAEKINSTLEKIDQAAFEMAVDTILNAKHIYIIGIRSCAPLASFMAFYFTLMFENVRLIQTSSSSEIFEQMVRIGKEDVIIGISFPRYSMRTLKAMEFANNRSAKVITLTDSVHSPMNLYSSCNLIADSDMASIVDSLVAPLSVINALIVALCMKKQRDVAKTLEMLEGIWDEYQVYENDEINAIDDSIKMRYAKIGDSDFMNKIIVIGGGPAGMFAAIAAAETGSQVILLEKNEKLGKKLFITGKGRCNITNAGDMDNLFANVMTNAKFLYSAFYSYDNQRVIDFFERNGLRTKTERGNRVFPVSDHSSDVIATLQKVLKEKKVKVMLHTQVQSLLMESSGEDAPENIVTGVKLTDGTTMPADAVIIATGGFSYQTTGSTGDGYRFAKEAGHTVTDIRPSLVPFFAKEDYVRQMQGLSLKNVEVRILNEKKLLYQEFGEMLFTHFGVSGPLLLSASAAIKPSLTAGELSMFIDLKPALTEEQLDHRLLREFDEAKNKQFKNSIGGLFPAKMIPVMLDLSGIDLEKKVNEITKEERRHFIGLIKAFPVTLCGLRDFNEAIITKGGVKVKEVNPSTMESKLVPHLYFCGEVLDLDAMTGGYNLQIAWSTGYLAGISAAQPDER